jgi:hypothetical protein
LEELTPARIPKDGCDCAMAKAEMNKVEKSRICFFIQNGERWLNRSPGMNVNDVVWINHV